MAQMGVEEQVSITVDYGEIPLDSDSEIDSSSSQFGYFTANGMTRVDDGNTEYGIIKKAFLQGMGLFSKDTNVVAIHKYSFSSSTGKARLESCRIFFEAVAKRCGGYANVRNAWYGASRDEICEIVTHGFSRCRKPEDSESYGYGIYLSPVNFTIFGALSSVMDENGLRHLILCDVTLGKMEVVPAGSKQIQPSSMEFDSGVDNLSAPRRYIIWSPYMNSHILLRHIVSFRVPSSSALGRIRIPVRLSPIISFPDLLSILSGFLPPSKMVLITKVITDYQENRLPRIQMTEILREQAGENLLKVIFDFCRNKKLPEITRSHSSESA
ncbi:hypothetical protein U1Q18_029164 [Sarracenia purpurea var. burkii]